MPQFNCPNNHPRPLHYPLPKLMLNQAKAGGYDQPIRSNIPAAVLEPNRHFDPTITTKAALEAQGLYRKFGDTAVPNVPPVVARRMSVDRSKLHKIQRVNTAERPARLASVERPARRSSASAAQDIDEPLGLEMVTNAMFPPGMPRRPRRPDVVYAVSMPTLFFIGQIATLCDEQFVGRAQGKDEHCIRLFLPLCPSCSKCLIHQNDTWSCNCNIEIKPLSGALSKRRLEYLEDARREWRKKYHLWYSPEHVIYGVWMELYAKDQRDQRDLRDQSNQSGDDSELQAIKSTLSCLYMVLQFMSKTLSQCEPSVVIPIAEQTKRGGPPCEVDRKRRTWLSRNTQSHDRLNQTTMLSPDMSTKMWSCYIKAEKNWDKYTAQLRQNVRKAAVKYKLRGRSEGAVNCLCHLISLSDLDIIQRKPFTFGEQDKGS